MSLIDEVEVRVSAGRGGDGCMSFRREKFVPYGGPNGGNGGRGGHVYFVATRSKQSLLDFRYQPIFKAQKGENGMGSDCDGKAGDDIFIQVPVGTVVFDATTNDILADLTEEETPKLIAQGGDGGKGNLWFKSSIQRAPRKTTPGKPGDERLLRLELRLMADIGLVGLPNAGKSSFLTRISRARPKVANYPFTTLEPILGVATFFDKVFVIADLPGLIEGAAQGVGLGHKFLRHISRTSMLLHLVDMSAPVDTIETNYHTIRSELAAYSNHADLLSEILVFTKSDLLTSAELSEKLAELKTRGLEGFAISSHTGDGLNELTKVISETFVRKPIAHDPLTGADTCEPFSAEPSIQYI